MIPLRGMLTVASTGALVLALLGAPQAPAAAGACPAPAPIIMSSDATRDLSGCTLPGVLFVGDFAGSQFTGADLRGSFFLNGANLDGADFTGANLTGVTFGNPSAVFGEVISMNRTNFTNATLKGVTWTLVRGRNLVGRPVSLDTSVRILGGTLFAPRVELSGMNLSTRSLSGLNLSQARLTGANLSGANLTSANLAEADLTGANLTGARLGFANLSKAKLVTATVSSAHLATANLAGVVSGGIVGVPADISPAWRVTVGRVLGRGIDMRGQDLSQADLHDMALPGADLTGTNLTGANLDGATLTAATLPGATLDGVHAFRASLFLADLTGASMKGALLRGANLQKARMHGASLDGANLVAADLRQVQVSGPVALYTCVVTVVQGMLDTVRGTCTARRIPLSARAASLRGARMTGAHLPGVNLTRVSLAGADLQGADLTGADLSRANLTGARVDGTVLTGANLYRARAAKLTGTTSLLPARTVLASGVIAGPGLNLSEQDLTFLRPILLRGSVSPVSLAGANLGGALISNLPLARTSLSGAITVGVHGRAASLPASWSQRGSALLGPNVDLSFNEDNRRPSLQGVDTRGVDLHGARMRNLYIPAGLLEKPSVSGRVGGATSLRGADLAGSQVSGGIESDVLFQGRVDMRDANLAGVRFLSDRTMCNVDLRGANLFNVTLDALLDSDVQGANLNGRIVRGARLSGTPRRLAFHDFIVRGHLLGPGHQVGGADLSGLDLHGRDLRGLSASRIRSAVDMCGVGEEDSDRATKLSGANLSGADLSGMGTSGYPLDARGTNFNGATLTNALIRSGFGQGLDFFTAMSDGATFRGISARGAELHLSGRIDLTNANLRSAELDVAGNPGQLLTLTGVQIDQDSTLFSFGERGQSDVVSGGILGTTTHLTPEWRLVSGTLLKN